jgi:hypothetical protein
MAWCPVMICKDCRNNEWEIITNVSIGKDIITDLPQFLFQCKSCKRVVMTDIQSTYNKDLVI